MSDGVAQAQPKKGLPVWVLVILIVVGVLVVFGGILTALAAFGVAKYVRNAKQAEARVHLQRLTLAVVRCADSPDANGRPRGLPPTAARVPATVPRGAKYQSSNADWAEESYACGSFSILEPQYFQYQWVLTSPSSGVARAISDLDGDGNAEVPFEQKVTCSEGQGCRPEMLTEPPR